MDRSPRELRGALEVKLKRSTSRIRRQVDEAEGIVVFGSTAAGVDGPFSDVDVLCIGRYTYGRLKSEEVDLITIPVATAQSMSWCQSELGTHIAKYGVPIEGRVSLASCRPGAAAIRGKRRRISAFMRALHTSWPQLEDCFRVKYSTKLRRECQRLILMEGGSPVPPTHLLDCCWGAFPESSTEVCATLKSLSPTGNLGSAMDLFERIAEYLVMHRGVSPRVS